MRAFTVYPWYAWAFAVLDKRVENRTWSPRLAPGEWVAVHAGVRRLVERGDAGALLWLLDDAATAGWDATVHAGGEVSFERDGAWARYDDADAPRGAVVAVAQFAGTARGTAPPRWGRRDPGTWYWHLPTVLPLERPVPVRGALGLWRLPGPVLRAVAEQVPGAVLSRADASAVADTNVNTQQGARCAAALS